MESYCNKNKIVLSKSSWNDFKTNMNEESEKMNRKYSCFGNSVRIAQVNLQKLDSFADELLGKYLNVSKFLHSAENNSIVVLKEIVRHCMPYDEVLIACCFIKYFFVLVLRRIHKLNPKYRSIKSLKDVHVARKNDKELAEVYDVVASDLGIDNSGHSDSCITQLYLFVSDYTLDNRYSEGRSKFTMCKEFGPEQRVKMTLKKIRKNDRKLLNDCISKVQSDVVCPNMKKALLQCLNTLINESSNSKCRSTEVFRKSKKR